MHLSSMFALWLSIPVASAEDGVWTREVSDVCFPSGLRVTVVRDDRQPVVALTTVIDAGSDADPHGKDGAAHLIEHLWFRSRPSKGARVEDRLRVLGAERNAYTLDDTTVFVTEAPVQALEELLRLQAAQFADPLTGLTDDVVAQEKRVVATELARAGGVHPTELQRFMPDAFDPSSPRGRQPSSPTTLAAIGRADLAAIAKRAYVPETTTLLVAGPVSADHVRDLVVRTFPPGQLVAGAGGPSDCATAARQPIVAPPTRDPRAPATLVRFPVAKDWVVVGWSLPPGFTNEDPLVRVATRVVERRIDRFLSRAGPGGESSECHYAPRRGASSFVCAFPVVAGYSGPALFERVRQHLEEQQHAGFPEGEITRVEAGGMSWTPPSPVDRALASDRAYVVTQISTLSALDSVDQLYDALSNHVTGSPDWYAGALDTLDVAEADDVRAIVDTWLSPSLAVGVVVTPGPIPGGLDAVLPDPGPLASIAPPPAPPVEVPPPPRFDVDRATLPNGLRVAVVRLEDVPVVHAALVFDRGLHTEPVPGLDAWSLWQTRAGPYPLMEGPIAAHLNEVGAIGWITSDHLRAALHTTGGSTAWTDMIDVLAWSAVNGAVPEASSDVDAEREYVRAMAQASAQDPDLHARERRLQNLLGPQHTFPLGLWQTYARGMKAPSLTIQAYHRAVWRPDRATLVVVGRVDAKTVEAYAASAFAGWTANGDARALGTPPELPDAGREVTSVVDARLLSSVSLACRVPDEPAVADVATALLDERLFGTVRESPTAAYAPSTGVARLPGTSLLQLSADVDPVRGGATADAFVAAVATLAGLTDADVARAVDRVRRSAVVGRVSGDGVLEAVLAPPPGPAPTPELVRSWFAACAGHESITIVGPVKRPFAGTSLDGAKGR